MYGVHGKVILWPYVNWALLWISVAGSKVYLALLVGSPQSRVLTKSIPSVKLWLHYGAIRLKV